MGAPFQFVARSTGTNAALAPVQTTLITKTAATAAWDSGVSSAETIAGDGFVEFVATQLDKDRFCGLSRTDTNQNYTSIGWGIELAPDLGSGRHIYIYESGVQKYVSGANAWTTGDVFRIERRDGTINFYQNGVWFMLSTAPDQSGNLRVDTSFYNQNGTLDGVRLYDGTAKAWKTITWQNIVGCTVGVGALASSRRLSIATPSSTRPGDQVVVVIGSQSEISVSATNVAWAFGDQIIAGTHRGFFVYRRIATDAEPAAYTFDLNERQEALAAALVYRNTDGAAAAVAKSCDDCFSFTTWPCPKRTLTRTTDLYLGMVMQNSVTGTMLVQADCAERVNFSQTIYGVATPRLYVFDFAANAVGATDFKRVTASVASDGVAGSIALAGVVPLGIDRGWTPIVMGAIGLPVKGI